MAENSELQTTAELLRNIWRGIIQPPYRYLPWLVLVLALFPCLIYTANGPFEGHVVGFDDNTRMVQLMQWINGGGWYDRLITRTNSPEGFQSIWARIVDVPNAIIILIAQQFVEQRTAALVSVVVIPVLEIILMFFSMRYFVRPIAGKKEAWLVVLFLVFTTVFCHKAQTLSGFYLGEFSHHAWYGILNVVMFGAAVRVVLGVAGWKPKLMLALAPALLLAVGIEGLPIIGGIVAIISFLSWWFDNHHLSTRGATSFAVAALMSLLVLPLHVPPENWLAVSLVEPSILGPMLLALAAGFLAVQNLLMQQVANKRYVACALITLAVLAAGGLLLAFPDFLAGGTAALSPRERHMASLEHPEVWTMFRASADIFDFITLLMPMLIAMVTGYIAVRKTGNKRRRMMFAAYTGCALVPCGLTQIYWRYIHHAQTSVCPLLLHAWQRIRQGLKKDTRYGLFAFFAWLAVGPFWMVYAPAMNFNMPVLSQVVLFPAMIFSQQNPCNSLTLADYLNAHYNAATNIMVADWDSSDFLYETNLHVDFLANFPSHDHFVDNELFFFTQDEIEPRRIAQSHKLDLVAICPYGALPPDAAQTRPYRLPVLIERLREGTPPVWLKPVKLPIPTSYLLFEVDMNALRATEPKGK